MVAQVVINTALVPHGGSCVCTGIGTRHEFSGLGDALTVTVEGVEHELSGSFTLIGGTQLRLDISSTIYQGQTVVVSYDKSLAGTNAIADAADNEVASFTTGVAGVPAVVNSSSVIKPNDSPVFATDLAVFTLPENSAANVVVGTVTATDADDDTLTYSLEGTDAASFAIDSGTGEIKTRSGVTYNYETKFAYEMTVKADDGNDGTDTIDVNIVLLNADEKSAKPAKPRLAAVPGSPTTLTATWRKPGLNGGPDITGYKLDYREGSGNWQNFAHSGTGVTATLTGLTANTEYQVRVRAENGETDSDWSDPSDAVRTNAEGGPPTVTLRLSDADGEVSEDAGAVRVRAAVSPASATAFTVTVSASPVAPATDDDFELSSNRVLSFAANATESTGTVTIRVVDDDEREPDDVVRVSGAVSNAAIPDPDDVTLTILDDDDTPPPPVIEDIEVVSTPRLRWRNSREEDTYGEGENIRIGVRFDQPVHVEGYPVLALEVGDPCISVCEARYESGSGTDTLVFAYLVLDTEIDRNGVAIPANPIGESIDDFDGFSIRNEAGQEARLSYRREGTKSGHKVDGTRQAGQYFSVEDAEAHEADGEMEFTVRLEPRGLGIVTVDYATRDGSARAGSDYTETSGTLRFNPLETERTVSVPITDDAHEDDGETFTLRLSNPQGALLRDGDRAARGRIRNSDPMALSAAFPASAFASSSHSGADDRPQAVVAFSEPVAAFGADTPSVSVTGGAVASVQPHAEDGLENAWVFFLVPDGGGDVTFALVADAACAAGGICTAGGTALTEVPAAVDDPGSGGSGGAGGAAADGVVRGRARGARRRERVHLPGGVQRAAQHDERPAVAGGRGGGDRGPGDVGRPGGPAPGPVGADGRAGLAGGRDGDARGRGGLRHPGGGLHLGRAFAVGDDLDDGGRPAGRGAGAEHAGDGRADDRGDAARRRDADRLDVGHLRRRRDGRRTLCLPVGPRRRGHPRRDRGGLHGG